MPVVFFPLLLHNGSSQRHVPVSVIGMGRKLYGSVWVSWPVHCAIGSSPGWFHSLGNRVKQISKTPSPNTLDSAF